VQNLVLLDDWVIQTNGLFIWEAALSCVEDDIQQGTSDGCVFLLKTGKFLIRRIILKHLCVLLLFLCLNSKEMIRKSFSFSVPVWDVTFTHAQVISRGWMCNDVLFLNLSFFYPKYVIFGVKWLHPVGNWNGVLCVGSEVLGWFFVYFAGLSTNFCHSMVAISAFVEKLWSTYTLFSFLLATECKSRH
jgi:hypothetical protein